MLKDTLKFAIRERCPNVRPLRRALSAQKVRQYKRYCLTEREVIEVEHGKTSLQTVVSKCRERWSSECSRIAAMSQSHYDRAGISLDESTLNDILFCYFAYGFTPDEYLCFGLCSRQLKERREFLSDRDRKIIVYSINDIIEIERFLDKWKTYKAYEPFFGRQAIGVHKGSSINDFKRFIELHEAFVIKNVRLSKGDSVRLVRREDIEAPEKFYDELVSSGSTILEELIVQSEVMAAINPSSVNTVRVITLGTKNGVKVVDCFLKAGRNGSFVDNGGAGGLLVGIDSETGLLSTDARDEFSNAFESHPDTRLHFQGYALPDWNELIELARKLSSTEESIPYIGWDFAHTEHGWVVVEGNASSQLIGPQIVTQTGSRKRMLNVLQDVKQIIPIEL